jgi:hypothetical protein
MANVKDQVVEEVVETTEVADQDQVVKEEPRRQVTGFTQEEVDDVIAKRLARERDAFAKKLGIEKFDAIDDFLKQNEVTVAEKEELTKKLSEVETNLLDKEFRLSALGLGVKPEHVDRAVKLAMTELSDEVNIDQALELVLGDFPMLKGEEQPVRRIGNQPTAEVSEKTDMDKFFDKPKYKNSKYFNK